MRTKALWAPVVALAMTATSTTGCIKKMLLDGQIESTRKASVAIDTLGDYEVANVIAFNGIGQFEGMHYLGPDNANALFMLTKGWCGAAAAFIEDQMEQAEDEGGIDSPLYLYKQSRARAAYERAAYYGKQLLELKAPGWDEAVKNETKLREYVKKFDKDDVPNLFWAGYSWVGRTGVAKDDPAVVADLYIGVVLVQRAVELDPSYAYGLGHVVLGGYHARSPMAEMDEAKKHFDEAIKMTEGKALMAKFQLAARYYCMKSDKAGYEKTLNEVLDAGDTMPEQRLQNTIAKRKAKRYLSKVRMSNCGF